MTPKRDNSLTSVCTCTLSRTHFLNEKKKIYGGAEGWDECVIPMALTVGYNTRVRRPL